MAKVEINKVEREEVDLEYPIYLEFEGDDFTQYYLEVGEKHYIEIFTDFYETRITRQEFTYPLKDYQVDKDNLRTKEYFYDTYKYYAKRLLGR